MKQWLWLIWLWPVIAWAQPQTGASIDNAVRKSFEPHYYKSLPASQVDSLLTNLAALDSVSVVAWHNQVADFWQLGKVSAKADLLIIKPKDNRTDYLVYSRYEYCSYFGSSVRFDPWVITVEHK